MQGTPLTIGGREFIVPRLRVSTYERAILAIEGANKDAAEDVFGLRRLSSVCGAIHGLLVENSPGLTVDDVKALVHLEELDAVLAAVLQAGGKRRVPEGEAGGP